VVLFTLESEGGGAGCAEANPVVPYCRVRIAGRHPRRRRKWKWKRSSSMVPSL
jgi:hypothetical protein